jgi:hypothetical protein
MMSRPETSLSEIRSWSYPRHGTIRQTVRGSHVDITVRLGRIGRRLWSTIVVFAGIGVLFIAMRIVEAFLTGRAQQILSTIGKAAN